jgi:hypothetical protein
VLNKVPARGVRHVEAAAALGEQGFPVGAVLYHRAAHGDAGNVGQAASEYEPTGKAAAEMLSLWTVVKGRLGL